MQVVVQFGVSEIVFCGDAQTGLIQRAQLSVGMFGGNTQGTVRQIFIVADNCFQTPCNGAQKNT